MYLKSFLKRKKILIFLVFLFFLLGQRLPCEPPSSPAVRNKGLKYFNYYNPKIEDLQPQNWFILQDKRGIIYSANQGGVLYDGIISTPFYTEADDYVKKHQLYHGIRLSSNDFALATLCGGLFIIDSLGSLKQIFNKDCGLPEHNVKYVYEDSQGLLTLINRLPDLLRLDSGKMKLQAAPQDIVPFLKGIADSSRGLAGLNKPELEFIAENLKKYNRIVY